MTDASRIPESKPFPADRSGCGPRVILRTSSLERGRSSVTILSDMMHRPWPLEGRRFETMNIGDTVPATASCQLAVAGGTVSRIVPFSGGHPSGEAQDVVTGFLKDDGEARGRPVGVAVDKSGASLIADDVGNTVWRVTAAASGT